VTASTSGPPRSCAGCAAPLADGARFCIHCGSPAEANQQASFSYQNPYGCPSCGGDGSLLPPDKVYCSTCRWLRPLHDGYDVDVNAFLWRLDADAMNVLSAVGPLTAAAHAVSERVGRPWFEASVNGLRLSEKQLPEIFLAAIRAARIMALQHLPEIYVSGEQMWDAATLGTDSTAFIVLGSVLTNFKGDDLLFVLGREMGHVRAGHALWKTVMQFVSGRARHRSIMGEGVLKLLNPAKLVESAIDAPLMAWSRHSEITADRAGMLVVGKEDVARRVLMTWTLKSFPLVPRVNADAWLEQEQTIDGGMTSVSEWTMSSSPYLAGRLRLLREFAASSEMHAWRSVVEHWSPAPPSHSAPPPPTSPKTAPPQPQPPPPDPNSIRLVCPSCKGAMRVPKTVFDAGEPVNVRCPNPSCKAVLTVTPKKPAAPVEQPAPETVSPGVAD
jgi:Zn-dependent protease with chaperone function